MAKTAPTSARPGTRAVKGAPAAPFAWYGGKAYYADWIIQHFPAHRRFVEPFGGAANVLLRKEPSPEEVYNDFDHRLVNFFKVLRNRKQFDELVRLSCLTPYSRAEFAELATLPEPKKPVEAAWWFFVRCRQARGGLGMSKIGPNHWAATKRPRRQMPEGVSKFLSAIDGLEDIAKRFAEVQVECRPAVELIRFYDDPETLFYCDPPYVPATRFGSQAATYGKEMSLECHEELLAALLKAKGKVILSGYDSELYGTRLKKWRRATKTVKAHLTNSGQKRLEVLWMNY